jgi:hypothetical protein
VAGGESIRERLKGAVGMLYDTLKWQGPFLLATMDFSKVPEKSGVYVFTEFATRLVPNPFLPDETDPDYEAAILNLRKMHCVLYVGKATTLSTRLPGYRFTPYLEIIRRPIGTPPRHQANRHKGRALLHAQQFFEGPLHLRWAETPSPHVAEATLIRELRPVLNTVGIE